MGDREDSRKYLGELKYPRDIEEALSDVTELPEDPEEQAKFFDRIQESLSKRLREES